ncbi:hypothetical protein LTR66_010149 [Elasticomyces elasticus]|nr:hypothetical protein LTR66_010149 [Elasticomyces elasticus]
MFLSEEDGLTNIKARVLCEMVRVEFDTIDQWFEEDTPIFVHPKDPFKRIDILASTRPIEISLQIVLPKENLPKRGDASKQEEPSKFVLAETTSSMHLFETSLPPRYYIPLTAINPQLLRKSETKTQCPYKGEAEYYHVVLPNGEVLKDLVWYYTRPTLECAAIAGMCCFYGEKVDTAVDGRPMTRPKTYWS